MTVLKWRKHSPFLVALLTGAVVGVVIMLFHRPSPLLGTSLLWRLELLSYDWRLPRHTGSVDDIVIVAIDSESAANIQVWPWPRDIHAKLLNRLSHAGARAIGMDIVFSDLSNTEVPKSWLDEPKPSLEDRLLEKALRDAGNVVLAAELQDVDTERGEIESQVSSAQFPHWRFEETAAGIGMVNFSKDVDGAVRRMTVQYTYQDQMEPSFALALLEVAGGDAARAEALAGRPPHPYLPDNTILINYPGPTGTYKTVPYYQALEPGLVPDDVFRDKLVLIGATDPLLQDIHLSPMAGEKHKDMAGVEIQAASLATLLQGETVWPLPLYVTWLVTLLFSLLIAVGTSFLRPLRALPALAFPMAALGVVVPFVLLHSHRLWLPMVAPFAALVISYTVVTVYMYVVEERARRAIRAAWQRRVAPEILEMILRDPELAYVKGRRTVATALFSDIRGFTAMCDVLQPEQVVQMLNEYLTEMTKVIRKHHGTVHKFIGDGIMAVFGDPIPSPDHADQAVSAALEMQRRLQEMRRASENPCVRQIEMGVGVHTGDVVAGDIGSSEFMEYTAIGATVSVASRLEALNKELHTGIIISEDTRKSLHGDYGLRDLGRLEIRGVAEPLGVYTIDADGNTE